MNPEPETDEALETEGAPVFVPRVDPNEELIWESSPSRYIAKISLLTGKEILRPIDPEDLLVHAHRDNHPVELTAQFLASRLIQLTGDEDTVRARMRTLNSLGVKLAGTIGGVTGSKAIERQAKKLMGVVEREVFFKFREPSHISEREVKLRIDKLKKQAVAAYKTRGRNPRLRVLLTGATGFLGKEILRQVVDEKRIEELIAVIRPEKIRDPKTKEVLKVLSPQERGELLLKRLGISGVRAKKFRFINGDIEKPKLGILPEDMAALQKSVTHVVHCAASVSFDDTYENSYRANVAGSRNALDFSLSLQQAKDSKFVSHIAIETSYIHGRKKRTIAQEGALVFPRNFYNNFYELTKAMASLDTDRFMIERGLRVTQLLPSIVIGHSRTGNNYGDTKVVNAPVNAFGRAKELAAQMAGDLIGRGKATLISFVAGTFPSDRSAELNIVPVDRVVEGIVAALFVPESIGERIHLATDNRIRSDEIGQIVHEELQVDIRMSDPTLFRNVTLPIAKAVLIRFNEPKLANVIDKLGTVFGGYSEWGQPIHEVGNDVRILGLSIRRPDTRAAFRMLCRHNKYVQEFGKLRDLDEIARRELAWEQALASIEFKTGRQVASISPEDFKRLLSVELDLKHWKLRT
jgi:nucleoside-diphosphate-sugar epimerase